ncbi:hypothetical protein FQN54_005038 [Arachnomyces sp. PD_36]|nr:hypothetical protein FQN54_005038 [Arachnomyces sp. PD_36]
MKNLRDKFSKALKRNRMSVDPVPRAPITDNKPTLSWERGEPSLQPYCSFDNGIWNALNPSTSSKNPTADLPSQFRVISWNIDAFARFGPQRMAGALEHLETLYTNTSAAKTGPLVIFLQEMTVDDLHLIQETDWVRKDFYITDLTALYWEDYVYGTTTLVEKSAAIERVFRVHYEKTRMGRDGLFVDLAIQPKVLGRTEGQQTLEGQAAAPVCKILRLCNTHLESLVSDPPIRPTELKAASRFLHPATKGDGQTTSAIPAPHAGIIAGDLNAFAPEDADIVPENSLHDTYLSLGGEEDTEPGYTWGMQSLRQYPVGRKPHGRLDKVLYCGGANPKSLERIGVGLKVDAAKGLFELRKANGEVGPEDEPFEQWTWVTDHLGLMADFELVESESSD